MSTDTVVDFSGKGLKLNNAEDAVEIAKKIQDQSEHLITINLEGNTLGIEAAKEIGKALEKASKLKYALLKDLFTGRLKTEIPDAIKHLTNGIRESKAELEELDLSDNAFGPIGMKALVDFLASESCSKLKVLKLNNNGLGIQGSTMLSTAIDKLKFLEVLICGRNRLENDGANAMSKSLQKLSQLTKLEMFQNGIRAEGMKGLSMALMANRKLVELNLNDNTMTEEGAIDISKGLECLSKLQVINFGDCLTRNEGFKAILQALEKSTALNCTVKELIMNGNEIKGPEIAEHFKSVITRCKNANFKVDLSSNCFGKDKADELIDVLKCKIDLIINDDEGYEDEIDELLQSPDTTLDDLCSQLVNISIKGFDKEKQKVSDKVLKQSEDLLAATSNKSKNSFIVANSLLVHMGLLKDEKDGSYKKVPDLRGPFLTLKTLSPKLDKTQKDVLQIFIGSKSNKQVDQTGKIKTQLMQSLFI